MKAERSHSSRHRTIGRSPSNSIGSHTYRPSMALSGRHRCYTSSDLFTWTRARHADHRALAFPARHLVLAEPVVRAVGVQHPAVGRVDVNTVGVGPDLTGLERR